MTPRLFPEVLLNARAAGRVLLDLTESDPDRCGLGWPPGELEAIATAQGRPAPEAAAAAARDAVASYLAGHGARVSPDHVVLVRSGREARRLVLSALCGDGHALVPEPGVADLGPGLRTRPYALTFDGRWHLDRRSVRRAADADARALLAGNPGVPTGATLSQDELTFLEALCRERALALVADESGLDAVLEPGPTVAAVQGCTAVHVSGLSGVCGLPGLEVEWLAVGGPASLARPLVARLTAAAGPPGADVASVPALLARREEFLTRLRARLGRNRSALASASLREAPWTLQWGGGWWAVLQINSALDGDPLCLSLLEEGVALSPGQVFGLARQGSLVVSLLPSPEIFDAALDRIDQRLRRPALL